MRRDHRKFTALGAMKPLIRAAKLALERDQLDSAAIYGSELGRCYYDIGDFTSCSTVWTTSLEYATRSKDEALITQIQTNLLALKKEGQEAM